jgi:hypothetical protein
MTNPLTELEAYTDAKLKEASVIPFSPAAILLSRKSNRNRNINQKWNKEQ